MSSQIKKSLLASLIFIFSSTVHADDIDILTAETLVDANILFVMDLSGSMNTQIDGSTATRLEELSGAFQSIVSDDDFSDVNFGLSVFSGSAQNSVGAGLAHGITYPVSPVIGTPAQDLLSKPGFTHPSNSYMPAAGTNNTRQYLSLLSSDNNIWSADGSTPIVDALFEAARYFRGEDVLWGRYPENDIRSAHPSSYEGFLSYATNLVTPAGTTFQTQTRTDPTNGINCTTNTGVTCSTESTSCGLGTNCSTQTVTVDRWCPSNISTTAACQSLFPSWYDLTTYSSTSCTTNSEGQSICSDITGVRGKEDIQNTTCDAPDTYQCDFPVDTPEVTSTSILGDAVYKSPIVQECAANGIILLTDGAPTVNRSADQVANMIGGSYANGCNTGSEDGRCGPELARFMNEVDHADGSRGMPDLEGIQNVKTYAVGLALDVTDPVQAATKDYLDAISINGNGDPAIIAGNQAELTQAFKDAINSVVGKARSFSSPSYTVDTSTLLTNGPYVYIPVFDRSNTLWPGNLKKYKIVNNVLTDADNKPALDPATNALLDDARDLWSAVASTDSIKSGGAANKINPSTRNILSDNGTNLISLSNSIPNADFGLSPSAADTAYKDDLVTFIKGTNLSDGTDRNHMGDIIHSKPVQLSIAGGRKVIFVGSNEGYLHAINDYALESDARNGTEAFAYMPNELLKNIRNQQSGVALPNHIYGVDGEITVWLDESANSNTSQVGNNVLDVANGEKAYLFFGLRRGGTTYTALEVTDPDSPRLVWSKSFDTGNSWSQPVVTNLLWKPNTSEKPVVIIGGGFNDDDSGNEIAGGNNIYVIDAITGDTVWSAATAFSQGNVTNFSGAALPNAVPARIRAIDLDRNNSVDRLYFGDTGGNIWRVDLNAANFDAVSTNNNNLDEAKLHRIAALGGTGANNRQFFEELDVAIFKRRGKLVASIAIGSGSRPNPLSTTVADKFFLIYDTAVTSLPSDPLITLASGNLKTVPVSKADRLDPNFRGWQKTLDTSTGEKILSSALTFQGKVLFNSFAVTNLVPDACNPGNTNENKLYVLDIFAGSEDLVTTQTGGEILETPKIVYPSDTVCQTGNCKREPKIGLGKLILDFPPPKDIDGNPIVDVFGNPVPGGGNALERVYWIDSDK